MDIPGQPKILAFAGSAREGSWNKKLVRLAAEIAEEKGAQVTLVDLRDYPMPIYDGDLEDAEGLPEKAKALKALMREHDAFLISSPEYNSSIAPLLKNTLDWCSRQETDEEPALAVYAGKVAGLLAASPGRLGGLRGLVHLRAILQNIGVIVVPDQVTVAKAYDSFDDDGRLTSAFYRESLEDCVELLVQTTAKISAS